MKVSEAMTREVLIARPDHTIEQAARAMVQLDAGVLPVAEDDRLVGMITDRDIAVRAVAVGKGADTPVREVMSSEVKYCFEDQDTTEVTANMGNIQVRRLPVLDRDKRLVGILSLGDVAIASADVSTDAALEGISQRGGAHSQRLEA